MFSVFSTALLGAVVGAVGNVIMPSRHSGGLITSVVLGIFGANMTNSIGWLMNFWREGSPVGYGAAVGGSLVVLIFYRMFATSTTA